MCIECLIMGCCTFNLFREKLHSLCFFLFTHTHHTRTCCHLCESTHFFYEHTLSAKLFSIRLKMSMGIVGVNSTAGRAVKCIDPSKTTKSESSWLGYTLCDCIYYEHMCNTHTHTYTHINIYSNTLQ